MNLNGDTPEWGASQWVVHPREPDGAYAEGEAGFGGSCRFRKRFDLGGRAVRRAVAFFHFQDTGRKSFRPAIMSVCQQATTLAIFNEEVYRSLPRLGLAGEYLAVREGLRAGGHPRGAGRAGI